MDTQTEEPMQEENSQQEHPSSSLGDALEKGATTSIDVVEAFLSHIETHENQIGAWAHLDPENAREQAREADAFRAKGLALGPLHGIPIAIKDIIATKDMPTEYGSKIHKGNETGYDATLIALLREAGAIILGKTITAEFAYFHPGKTRNPHNHDHTPGGSSSGSAAAVAAGMCPLSIGTQTNGSMIRPASYCGVFGFKPTFGRISRHGVLTTSSNLDTVGIFGSSLSEVASCADVLMAYDAQDKAMKPIAKPQIETLLNTEPPVEPAIAFVRTPVWERAEQTTKDAFRELIEYLPNQIKIVDLPPLFEKAHDALNTIMAADFATNFKELYQTKKDQCSGQLIEIIERGQKISKEEYKEALALRESLRGILDEYFEEYDAILTPSAPGEAPEGLSSTGDPSFCTIWTLCGTPALNLPIFEGPNGLPIGAQLVGNIAEDAKLFRTAKWLIKKISE